jgi:hypothetical protein
VQYYLSCLVVDNCIWSHSSSITATRVTFLQLSSTQSSPKSSTPHLITNLSLRRLGTTAQLHLQPPSNCHNNCNNYRKNNGNRFRRGPGLPGVKYVCMRCKKGNHTDDVCSFENSATSHIAH